MRRLLIVISFLACIPCFSQGLKVKEFKQNISDGSAFHAPMDSDGRPCGLIKVRTSSPELLFRGNVIGEVENKMNEYWVYMSPSSQTLKVIHPNFMPLVIDFTNYGVDVSSKATYILTLEETKYKKEKNGVTFVVKPEDAELLIDDMQIENISGNGYYQLYLAKGEHVCRFSKAGYRPSVKIVSTGKENQEYNIEMESVMAEIDIKCRTATAELYIDGELKGNGAWKGQVLPGEHILEARQKNFASRSIKLEISEKESKSFVIPELKRAKGKLYIETSPSGVPIILDGKETQPTPFVVETESGTHYVSCDKYGCKLPRKVIEVSGDEMTKISLNLEIQSGYEEAYKGDAEAILETAYDLVFADMGQEDEAVYWIYRHPDRENVILRWPEYTDGWPSAFLFNWIEILCNTGKTGQALEMLPRVKQEYIKRGYAKEYQHNWDADMMIIGHSFFKKKEYAKAVQCYEKAGIFGYEGMGDYYAAMGDKQKAAPYYMRCLELDIRQVYPHIDKERVEKKLNDLRR